MNCILVVEDETLIRDMLVEVLRDAGFDIIEAVTADAAVPLLTLEGVRLIVTDINLPGQLDGIELALAARQTHPDIPVVFISGRPGKLEEARALGSPVAFLQKPFSFKSLIRDVNRLISAM